MAITRYAGDRFTVNTSDTKPTGVLDGAYLIDTGNLTQWVRRTAGGTSQWNQLAGGGGGGGTPGGANTQVQFNNAGAFGGDADLTFTNGNRLNVNKLGISGNIYDSNNSIGEGGMVLTNEGTTGVNWKNIESVLSGVGGSGVANYVARWSDEDTITSGVIQDDGTAVGINQAADPDNALAIKSIANNTNPLQIAAHDGDSLLVFRQTAGDGRLSIKKDGGVETIRLDSDNVSYINGGNFGLGTAAPAAPLDVQSANGDSVGIRVTNGYKMQFLNGSNNTNSNIYNNGASGVAQLDFQIAGATKVTIDNDGDVGIGTTTPSAKLFIKGDSTSRAFHAVGSSTTAAVGYFYTNEVHTGTTTNAAVSIRSDHASSTGQILHVRGDGSGDLLTLDQGGTSRVVVKADGDVDILNRLGVGGAHSGSYGLYVHGTSYFDEVVSLGSGSMLRRYESAWTNATTHDVLLSSWYSALGDYLYLKVPGNSVSNHGAIVISDGLGTFFGHTDVEIGPITNSGTAPLTTTHARIGATSFFNGSVGIGTTDPGGKLESYITSGGEKGLRLNSNFAGGNTVDFIPAIVGVSNAGFSIDLAGTNRFVINSGGNVGVGTNLPTSMLQVDHSGGADVDILTLDNNRNTQYDKWGIKFQDSFRTRARIQTVNMNTGNARAGLAFEVGFSTDTVERMRINDNGNVGIGTDNPLAHLMVGDGNRNAGAAVQNQAGYFIGTKSAFSNAANKGLWQGQLHIADDSALAAGIGGAITFGATQDNTNGTYLASIEGSRDNATSGQYGASMIFRTRTNGSAVMGEHMVIASDGNVGIGTITPLTDLDVRNNIGVYGADSSTSGQIYLGSSDFANSSYFNSAPGIGAIISAGDSQTNGLGFYTYTGASNSRTEKMRIEDDGKVGIGTTTPLGKLHVYGGQVRILDSTASPSYGARLVVGRDTAQDIEFYVDDLNCKIIADQDSDTDGNHNFVLDRSFAGNGDNNFQIQKGGSSQLLINTDGNVGINNTSPEHRLHVAGDAIISGYLYDSTNSTGVDGYVLTSKEDGPQWKMIEDVLSGVGGNGTANYIPKWIDSDTIGDSVIAESGGNIGIGTVTPEQLFEISATGDAAMQFQSTATQLFGGETIGAIKFKNNDSSGTDPHICGAIASIAETQYGRAGLAFSTGRTTEFAERMRIRWDGNVGIAITDPDEKLEVDGNIKIGSDKFYRMGGDAFQIGADGSSVGMHFHAGGSERMTLLAGGNVGIGVTSANAKLKVVTSSTDVAIFQSTHATTTNFYISNSNATASNTANLYFGPANGVNGALIQAIAIEDFSTSANRTADLAFQTRKDGTFAEHMRIDSSGNVGIGTNNPTGKFQIGANYTIPGTSYGGDDIYIANTGSHSNYDPSVTNTDDFRALIAISDGTTTGPIKPGLILYNDDTTAGGFSPMLLFAKRETGASPYKAATAAIYARSPLGTGNSNSWIDGELIFATAGAATQGIRQRMVINKEGLVGIGTNAPTEKLDVEGSLVLNVATGTGLGEEGIFFRRGFSDSNKYNISILAYAHDGAGNFSDGISINGYDGVSFCTGSNTRQERMRIVGGTGATSGYVGIGTTSPSNKLVVVNSDTDTTPTALLQNSSTGDASLHFNISGRSYTIGIDNSDGDKFKISRNNGLGTTDRLTIDGDGSVGIGINSPDSQLHVLGDTLKLERANNAPAFKLYNNSASPADDAALGYLQFTGKDNNGTANMVYSEVRGGVQSNTNSAVSGYLSFLTTNNGTAVTEAMRIKADGSVGIATTNPAAKLDVRGNILRSGLTFSSWTSRSINTLTQAGATINYILIAPKTTINVRLSGRFNCARSNGVSAVSIAHADVVFCTDNDANPQSGGIHSASSDIPSYGHANFEIVELEYSSTEYYALKISPSASWTAAFSQIEFEGISNNVTWTNIDSGNVSNVGAFGGSQAVFAYKHANVGIGTDSPSARLHITSDGSHDEGAEIVLRHANNNSTDVVSTLSFQNNGGQVAMIQAGTTSGNTNGYISLFTDNSGTSGERMRITSGGNVGIGTNVPSAAYGPVLHIRGANPVLRLDGTGANSWGWITMNTATATEGRAMGLGPDGSFRVTADPDSMDADIQLKITQAGAVQFGDYGSGTHTGTTAYRLSVDSSGNIIETAIGAGYVDGSGTANTIPRWTDADTIGDSIITVPSNTSVQMAGELTLNYTSPILNIGKLNTSTGNAKLRFNSKNGTAANAFDIQFVKSATEDRLDFLAGGATTMASFLNGGQVGIGTTAPASLLHVGGAAATPHAAADDFVIAPAATDVGMTIRCNSNSGTGSIFFADTAANAQGTIRYNHNSDYMSFYSTGDFFFDGSVGIGTNAPNELLEVDGNIRLGDGTHRNIIGPTNATLGIYSNPNDSNEGIKFSTDGGSTIEMFLQDGGNVGIGTETPKEKLHVNNGSSSGDGVVYPLRLSAGAQASTAGDATGIKFIQRDQYNDYGGYIRLANTASNPGYLNPRLEFGVQNTNTNVFGSVSTKMVITGGGSVGIGEVTPGTILHLKQNDAVGPTISLTNNPKTAYINFWGATGGGTDRTNQFEINAVHTGYGITLASKDYVRFKTDGIGAADEAMRINSDGNVGIGTTSPDELLEVGNDGNTDYALIGPTKIGGGFGHGDYAGFSHRDRSTTTSYALLQHTGGTTYLNSNIRIYMGVNNANYTAQVESDRFQVNNTLKLNDNSKIKIGSSDDLEIYHDGSNSYIKEASTGDIILDTNSNIRFKSSTEHLLNAAANGAVELYYNNAKTFETTASGVKLTQSASYLFGGDGEILAGQDSGGYYFATGAGQNVNKPIFIGDNASYIKFKTSDSEAVRIDANGNVGIGTTNPGSYKLLVNGNSYLDGTAYVDGLLTVDGDIDLESAGQYITFYGNSSADHSISSRNSSGNAADDLRINTYGALFINLDSNGNNTSGADFSIGRHGGTGAISDWLLDLSGETGQLKLNTYGSETHTGTAAYQLAVDANGNVIETTDGGGNVSGSGTNNYLTRWTGTNSVGNSNIFDNGTIGIGTAANLNGKVTIREAGNSGGPNHIFCMLSSAAVGHGAAMFLKTSTNTSNNRYGARIRAIRNANDNAAADLAFSLENTAANALDEVVRFTSDGCVGIGTTSPGELLDVGGDANEAAFIGKARIGMMGYAGYAAFGHRALGDVAAKYAVLQDANGGSYFNAASGQTVSFRIANSDQMVLSLGQLKFPDSKKIIMGTGNDLEIYHNSADSFISDVGTGNLVISGSGVWIKNAAINANMIGCVEGSGGYVKLYQNGNEKLATTSAGVTVTGTLTETSSIALKENVETYTPSLDIINKIRPVKYNRKENKKKKEIGLIAEELAELFPELVEKDEKGNPSSVNYSRAVTVLLGGFKELYKEVQELKKRI